MDTSGLHFKSVPTSQELKRYSPKIDDRIADQILSFSSDAAEIFYPLNQKEAERERLILINQFASSVKTGTLWEDVRFEALVECVKSNLNYK